MSGNRKINKELVTAVYDGKLEKVLAAIKNRGNVNLRTDGQKTLLMVAVSRGSEEIVKVMDFRDNVIAILSYA